MRLAVDGPLSSALPTSGAVGGAEAGKPVVRRTQFLLRRQVSLGEEQWEQIFREGHMKFTVRGANSATGAEVSLEIEARDVTEAETKANSVGIPIFFRGQLDRKSTRLNSSHL